MSNGSQAAREALTPLVDRELHRLAADGIADEHSVPVLQGTMAIPETPGVRGRV